ncbi:MAG: endopeptidase La [Bacteroidia bacterium]|jgi:ATP-dependent Lon protease|nr:endopeptidase La [Bacteroidia bacterium]MBP7261373.1 endopeptidase La [Bacteroidia bacterium]MBP9179935.1 endopeptidase La [Bacteroidia bacterium]MBP9724829.1 endopeptidase La [Bacteroidia bacterium]
MNDTGNLILSGLFQDDKDNNDFIQLLSQEEEDEMNREKTPETLPILPLRNTVLFPGVVIPITVGRDKSIKLIKDAHKGDKIIGVVSQKDALVEDPNFSDLNTVGTVAQILKMLRMPDGNTTVIIQGKKRFVLGECQAVEPYIRASVSAIDEKKTKPDEELKALISSIKELSYSIIEQSPNIPSEAGFALKNIDSPTFLVNFISSNLNVDVKDKQTILEVTNFKDRAAKVLEFLTKELQMLQLKNEIQSKVRNDLDKQQRDFFLQQQIRALQEELGQDSPDKEIENLRARGAQKKWNKTIHEAYNKELDKLMRMNPMSPDYSVSLNYVQTLIELPWGESTKDNFDLKNAQKVLDKDHFGMDKVKDRILEYLAVLKLKGDLKSPILCLYGPPGVGKTSLGKSIAKALGRKYVRVSLGGLHDEAEVRGHRKTYIGAMPGRIIQNIKKAKTDNPVFVLDEIDKVGSDFRGDPSSALLEVLDPEQNSTFYDNYLELEYDLSNVMFIATANSLDTIQPALLDRLEIIEINGYTLEEKIEISKKYLLPKQRKFHGLKTKDFGLTDKAITKVIEDYTRESGVRGLEKKISSLARSVAKSIVMKEKSNHILSEEDVLRILGAERMEKEMYQDNDVAGVVTGLAWTPVGGEILFVESSITKGKGKLTLTGKLGDVMKESAITALSFLKGHCDYLDIDADLFDNYDIHIHVPAGAVPKDGPSAGVTMLTSLASLFTQRKVKSHLAMTGEITLRGKVLPVGGIKEKILAAKRAGIKEIILCEQNRKDIEDIKPEYISDLTFHYAKNMLEVLDIALLNEKVTNPMKLIVTNKEENTLKRVN